MVPNQGPIAHAIAQVQARPERPPTVVAASRRGNGLRGRAVVRSREPTLARHKANGSVQTAKGRTSPLPNPPWTIVHTIASPSAVPRANSAVLANSQGDVCRVLKPEPALDGVRSDEKAA